MKCQHCGNNLNIEENFCPYCGQPNPFAVKHQEAMRRFEKDYERFNRHTVRITILAVLLALIAATAFLLVKADDIRWWRMEKRVEAQADRHREAIGRLMDERNYLGVYSYISKNDIRFTDTFREYDAVSDSTFQYRQFYSNLMMLQAKKTDTEAFRYYSEAELLYGKLGTIRFDGEDGEEYAWSLKQYKANVAKLMKEDDSVKGDWDELEKSIVANIASDVQVGVTEDHVKMVIYLNLD